MFEREDVNNELPHAPQSSPKQFPALKMTDHQRLDGPFEGGMILPRFSLSQLSAQRFRQPAGRQIDSGGSLR